MDATNNMTKTIVPSFVVQEESSYELFVYLSIPELKVRRSFRNFFKLVPSNAHVKILDFQNQSFAFTINVQKKLYSISIARLPGQIKPEFCSIKYQCAGCWILLNKLDSAPWMDRICDDITPGLNIQENNDPNLPVSTSPSSQPVLKKDEHHHHYD